MPTKHFIFIGFKHTGKSTLGTLLAKALDLPFIDLDQEIIRAYYQKVRRTYTCRQIVQTQGKEYFTTLEHDVLRKIIEHPTAVIALGGSTVLHENNLPFLQQHCLIHLKVQKEKVFERIIAQGLPVFLESDKPYESFLSTWEQRMPCYQQLANLEVENNQSLIETLEALLQLLNRETNEKNIVAAWT